MQERQITGKTIKTIEHADDVHFVLNMHALHNAHLLRRVLPRQLVKPRHIQENRLAFHAAAAERLGTQRATRKRVLKAKKAAAKTAKTAAGVEDMEDSSRAQTGSRKRRRT
jgi:hypothetical protein